MNRENRILRKVQGSFTVEAAYVVPIFVIIIMMGIHLGSSLCAEVQRQTEKPAVVETLDPVKTVYRSL